MAGEPFCDQLVFAAEAVAHFKAAGIEPGWFDLDRQGCCLLYTSDAADE